MKSLALLFSMALNANAAMTTPFMFKEDAANSLKAAGLTVASVTDDATIYGADQTADFHLLVSKGGLKSQIEAAKFCASHPGYELANTYVVQYLLQAGFPFPEMWPVSFINVPILYSKDGVSGGAVVWFKLSEQQKQIVASRGEDLKKTMDADDYIFVVTSMTDQSTWGLQSLSEVNAALKNVDAPLINIPAVCATAPKTLEPTP